MRTFLEISIASVDGTMLIVDEPLYFPQLNFDISEKSDLTTESSPLIPTPGPRQFGYR